MQKVQRLTPVDDPFPTVVDINSSGTATEKQRNFIRLLFNRKGLTLEQQKAMLGELCGEGASVATLSPAQASALIKALQA
jgi:hypothetical protein